MERDIVLVFGTSADPFHKGHTELVVDSVRELARRSVKVKEVLIMPVFRHHNVRDGIKRSLPLTFEHRFAMCELAALELRETLEGEVNSVQVSDLEKELVWQNNRPNFTAETMSALRHLTDPDLELAFLIGADSFAGEKPTFLSWYHWEKLLLDSAFVISPRQGFEPNREVLERLISMGGRLIYLDNIKVADVSSRQIRARLISGEDPFTMASEGLLSRQIASYIEEHDLVSVWEQTDSTEPPQAVAEDLVETDSIEVRIGKLLFQKKLTLGLAESCTGGLIGHILTNVPGSSEYFMGSIVSYAYQAKVNLLGVSWDTLKKHGAVSSETVLEMARGARRQFNSDLGLSVCCIAGPGGATADKPVGTSWIGLSTPEGDWSYHNLFEGDRLKVKESVAQEALLVLLNYLKPLK